MFIFMAGVRDIPADRSQDEPLGPLAGPEPYVESQADAARNYGPVPRLRPKTVGYFCDRYAY
jgi:hypothetical protein